MKGILNDTTLVKTGVWYSPKSYEIGYLDQHYKTLSPQDSVFETIKNLVPEWDDKQIRNHLNAFLFRKNEEVETLVSDLSGGEKARLALAQIGAKTPKLLILDEITNNLDRQTCRYVLEVLQHYPGAMIVISHNKNFLDQLHLTSTYLIDQGKVYRQPWRKALGSLKQLYKTQDLKKSL